MENESRLQKIIADSGVASRRKAEEMIAAGRVTVNGVKAALGTKADPQNDRIAIDGEELDMQPSAGPKVYLALYKPRGIITTMHDEKDRKCVEQLLEGCPVRLFPVGRLDKDSEGLLLMTNDGDFANKLMHPSTHVSKTYRVTVRPGVNEQQLNTLSSGMLIDGQQTQPAIIRVVTQEQGRVVLEFTIYEGKNRQIRKMCEQVGLEVARLKRTSIGCVKLGMMRPGEYRELTAAEIKGIWAAMGKNAKNPVAVATEKPKRVHKSIRYEDEKRPAAGKRSPGRPENKYKKNFGPGRDSGTGRRKERQK